MSYRIREKLAYSFFGKLIATVARNLVWKQARVHWIQQAFADWSWTAWRVLNKHYR